MTQNYGMNRVLEPQHVLPTSAWRLDNSRAIGPGAVSYTHLDVYKRQASKAANLPWRTWSAK